MSQNELAKKAGISRATLAKAERGVSIELDNLLKIANALGVEPADLFISEKDRAEISYKHKLLVDRFTEFLELEKKKGE